MRSELSVQVPGLTPAERLGIVAQRARGSMGEGAGFPARRSPRTFLGSSSATGALKGGSRSKDLRNRHPGNPDRGG